MKKYKLTEDIPPVGEKGEVFEEREDHSMRSTYGEHAVMDHEFAFVMKKLRVLVPVSEDGKPAEGERYWIVSDMGTIRSGIWRNDDVDQWNFKRGNCFPTEKAAEAHKAAILAK